MIHLTNEVRQCLLLFETISNFVCFGLPTVIITCWQQSCDNLIASNSRETIYNLVDIKIDSEIKKQTNLLLYLIHSKHKYL